MSKFILLFELIIMGLLRSSFNWIWVLLDPNVSASKYYISLLYYWN